MTGIMASAIGISMLLLKLVPTRVLGAPINSGGLHGIAFISVTTDDLDTSLRFYTQVSQHEHQRQTTRFINSRHPSRRHVHYFFSSSLQSLLFKTSSVC